MLKDSSYGLRLVKKCPLTGAPLSMCRGLQASPEIMASTHITARLLQGTRRSSLTRLLAVHPAQH